MRALGWVFVLVLIGGAAAGGYVLWNKYQAFMSGVAACKQESSQQQTQLLRQARALASAKRIAAETEEQKTELDALRRQEQEAQQRSQAFNALKARLKSMIDTGKLDVLVRQGRMIVKLPAQILFKSGEADLSPSGQDALAEVASALKDFSDRRFMVAGHTDDQPVTQSSFKDNWELSTARAVTVTEFLIQHGLNPKNLVAAGYGPYDPIASNGTPKGRAENRRIELELLPNVGELPQLVDQAARAAAPAPSASAAH
jgi:chemotaxis protein MotB